MRSFHDDNDVLGFGVHSSVDAKVSEKHSVPIFTAMLGNLYWVKGSETN